MKTSCPHCGQHITADDSYAGMTVTCPGCAQDFQLAAGPPPVPPAAPPAAQGAPSPAPSPAAAPAQSPSKVADTLAYCILFVPAFFVWKSIGGIVGLFVGALILFLFRVPLAALLRGIGGLFGGAKAGNAPVGGPKVGKPGSADLKEMLPAAGALLFVLLLVFLAWWRWSSKEHFTYTKATRGKLCTVTILNAKGEPVGAAEVIFIDERARGSVKKEIPGQGLVTVGFAGFEVGAVTFRGEWLKEKGSSHFTYSSAISGTNATLIIHDADGKVVRALVAIGVAAPPGPANQTHRADQQSETNSVRTVTSVGRGHLQERVKRPNIKGELDEVLLVEAEFDRGRPTRVTYQGKVIKPNASSADFSAKISSPSASPPLIQPSPAAKVVPAGLGSYGRASGQLTVDGLRVELAHAIARKDITGGQAQMVILATTRPLPPNERTARDWSGIRELNDGFNQGIELHVDAQGNLRRLKVYHAALAVRSGRLTVDWPATAPGPRLSGFSTGSDRVAGRGTGAGGSAPNRPESGLSWSYSVQFDAPFIGN